MYGEGPTDRIRRWFQLKPVVIRRLLLVNIAVYLVVMMAGLGGDPVRRFIIEQFALTPDAALLLFKPWQLLSYSVLHLNLEGFFFGLIHISFNLLWLVWIGQEVEELYGARFLVWLWVMSTLAGGLVTVLLHTLFPGAAAFAGPVYGATTPVVGVAAATATLWPHKRIALLFIGPIPLRTALLVFLALDVLVGLNGSTFFAAHLGGAAAAVAYVRFTQSRGGGRSVSRASSRRRPRSDAADEGKGLLESLERWLSSRGASASPPAEKEEPRAVDPDQDRVDRILDKISEQGYESLTDEEKRILYEASKH